MKWVDDLRGKVVGVDTAPFVYYLEAHTNYIDMLRPFFQAVEEGDIIIVTSVITLTETLGLPLRNREWQLVKSYRDMLYNTKGIRTIMTSQGIAEEAAQLRALHNFRTPDAIHMATAIKAQAACFLTNDRQLQRASTIPVLVLDDLK